MSLPGSKGLIVFDGYCFLCNNTVKFLLRIDKKEKFLFTHFESDTWKSLAPSTPFKADSIVYVTGNNHYIQSEAVLKILSELGYPWKVLNFIKFIPFNWREKLYRLIARNRYHIFGKRETCSVPGPRYSHRFLP